MREKLPSLLASLLLSFIVSLGTAPFARASSITYDLKSDWSNATNPNGVWAYKQGTTVLPYQTNIGGACCTITDGIGGGWAPGMVRGSFLPFWVQAIGSTPGYLAGDILVHSVDSSNGNPALGEATVTWTAPVAGIINITGGLWYGQWALNRSNDFFLKLGATQLAQGTVSYNDIYDRSNPFAFNVTGLAVNAGDVLQLTVQKSSGFSFGTIAGVNLTITETPTVPEPASLVLLTTGLAAVSTAARRRRSRAS